MARRKKRSSRAVRVKKGEKATFFRRFVAYIVDLFIIGLVISLPLGFAYAGDIENMEFLEKKGFDFKDFLMSTFLGILTVLYWGIFEYKLRQSPGKAMLGIYVKSKRKTFTFTQALVRNLTKISTVLLVLDCLYMFFKKTNQRYIETIAETEVLRK